MKILTKIFLKCAMCGHQSSVAASAVNSFLDDPLSINNVGQIYGRFRCKNCGGREICVSDDSDRLLIDPALLKMCRGCGAPIPLPRVRAMPNSEMCVPCTLDAAKPHHSAAYPHPRRTSGNVRAVDIRQSCARTMRTTAFSSAARHIQRAGGSSHTNSMLLTIDQTPVLEARSLPD